MDSLEGGIQENLEQLYFNLLEVVNAKSLSTIPIFHREKWKLLMLNETAINKDVDSLFLYGDPELEYGLSYLYYGGKVAYPSAAFKLPGTITDVQSFLTNRIHSPSLILTKNVDFMVKNGVILFKSNPFENSLVPIRNLYDSEGNIIDRQCAIWALNCDEDYKFLWDNFGYLFNINLQSGETYRSLLKAIWNLYMSGPRREVLASFINTALGLPVTLESEETVEKITDESIVTDKNYYDIPKDKQAVFQLGQQLRLFTPLCNQVDVWDSVGRPEWWNTLSYGVIPLEVLDPSYTTPLIFNNDLISFPLEVGVSFSMPVLGTIPTDKQPLFQNYIPKVGEVDGVIGDTIGRIRPLDWAVSSYFKSNFFFIKIITGDLTYLVSSSKMFSMLKEAIPAYTYFLVEQQLPFFKDTVIFVEPCEELTVGKGFHLEDEITSDNFSDGYYGCGWVGMPGVIGDPGTIGEKRMWSCIRILKSYH